jgi:hypothetical protein
MARSDTTPGGRLVAATSATDPLERLAAVQELRRELERLELTAVRDARLRGKSWAEIGAAEGLPKQVVHRKFAGDVEIAALDHGPSVAASLASAA